MTNDAIDPRAFRPRRDGLICLVLVAGTFVCFMGATRLPFCVWDDPETVANNPVLLEGLMVEGLVFAFTDLETALYWHPLTWLTHMFDAKLYGREHPGGHHLTGLLFHMANVGLVFLVLRRMTGDLWRCAFVAALFALHPLNVEPVVWISSRKDVLSTFFFPLPPTWSRDPQLLSRPRIPHIGQTAAAFPRQDVAPV